MTRTMEATYEDGILVLDEPVDLATRSRVRVRIESPPPDDSDRLLARINAAYADAPDEEERELQRRMTDVRRQQAEEW